MVNTTLLDDLCDFISSSLSNYQVIDEKSKLWDVAIIRGFLPPKRTDESEDYEKFCVLVRHDDGESDWIAAENQVKSLNRMIIAVRTTSFDPQIGPRNTMNLMAFIQREIYASPMLANRYRAAFPLKWKAPDGQSLPIWQGEMIIPWITPVPQEIYDMGIKW